MIKHHIKLAWRTLVKNKLFTVLNLMGLSCGILFTLLIALFTVQSYSINQDLRNLDNQYALQSSYRQPGIGIELTSIAALPRALKEEYPDLVANYYRFDGISCIVSNDAEIHEEHIALGDSTLLTMFGFPLLDGDQQTALVEPSSVVISKNTALKYFGSPDAVGESITIRNFKGQKKDFVVTGVLESLPKNSVFNTTPDINNEIFISSRNQEFFQRDVESWYNPYIVSFVELQNGVRPDQLTEPIKNLLHTHADPSFANNLQPLLKPLSSYYLDDNNGAVRKMSAILIGIAGFILCMAIINFVNLSISLSIEKSKEIGVRKILGESRSQIAVHIAAEAMMLVIVAASIALAIYPLLSSTINDLFSLGLPSLTDISTHFIIYYVVIVLLLGLLSGLYPAIHLSKVDKLNAVKGQTSSRIHEKQYTKHVLLSIQCVIALVVLIGTLVISKQTDLFLGKDLGYEKDFLITAPVPRDWSSEGLRHIETIRQELIRTALVEDITLSYDIPGALSSGQTTVRHPNNSEEYTAQLIASDPYFADTYGIPLLAGTFLHPTYHHDAEVDYIVINEQLCHLLGFARPQDAINQRVTIPNMDGYAVITGVTANFYPNSMHSAMLPILWWDIRSTKSYRYFTLRLESADIQHAIADVEARWKTLFPDAPFEFQFMDATIKHLYKHELQMKHAAEIASFISLLIVVLGVVGLVSLTVQQRVKEIGIRRVLGASFRHILHLFLRSYLKVFVISVCIAIPIAYSLMQHWLNDFHLKTTLDLPIFFIPTLSVLGVIALLTIVQIKHVIRANPGDSLRDE